MKKQLEITHSEGKAEQCYTLVTVEGFMVGSLRYTIYESSNFFGRPVTLGVEEMTGTDNDGREHYQVTVKAAVCSEEDTYSPELGRSIVLGRLVQAEHAGIQITNISDEQYQSMAEAHVAAVAEKLADYLLTRSSTMMLQKMSRAAGNHYLREAFEVFK